MRGDVIFYRPEGADSIEDLARGDLNKFAVLAAYSQTIPYAPGAFKPWHHVAVSISENNSRVIGFDERDYQPGEAPAGGQLANTVLKETDGEPPTGLVADALRPPTAAIADGLVAESEAQINTDYAAAGLMPFALITAAWMIPDTLPGRDRLRTMAFGANAVARRTTPQAESCATAVAKAVIVARRGSSLSLVEPPSPASASVAGGFANTDQVKALRALIPRLDEALGAAFDNNLLRLDGDVVTKLRNAAFELPPGRLTSIGKALEGVQDNLVDKVAFLKDIVRVGGVRREHGELVGIDVPDEVMAPAPGEDTTIPEYTGMVQGGLELYAPGTDFEGEGESVLDDRGSLTLQSDDYLISPAILWDALIKAGFQQVAF